MEIYTFTARSTPSNYAEQPPPERRCMPGQNDSHHSESEEKAASERSADYRSHRIDRALKTAIGGTTEEEEEKEHKGILAVGRSASQRGAGGLRES